MGDNPKHPTLKKADFEEISTYLRACADLMELRDWTFNLAYEEPKDDKSGAAIECIYGRKWADVFIRGDAPERPIEEFRQTIAHELVHCHLIVMWQMVQTDLLPHLGQTAYDLYCDAFRRGMEYAVEALSESIAPRLPLIQWPADKKKEKKK